MPAMPSEAPVPGRYYTAQEDRLLRELGARGVPWEAVYARLGKSSPAALRARFLRMESPDARALRTGAPLSRPDGTTRRACMCCREPFESAGPHNRMCAPCRADGEPRLCRGRAALIDDEVPGRDVLGNRTGINIARRHE